MMEESALGEEDTVTPRMLFLEMMVAMPNVPDQNKFWLSSALSGTVVKYCL